MLHDLLTHERTALLAQCESKVLSFGGALKTPAPAGGWAIFYDELIELLDSDQPCAFHAECCSRSTLTTTNARDYVRLGYTVSEVVQSYRVISEAISEFAQKLDYPIKQRDFLQLNSSIDHAIAEAVTEYEQIKAEEQTRKETQRLGFLAHELRNSLQSATIALEVIESGAAGIRSNTGEMLQTSLQQMAKLIDSALTEVRMRVQPSVHLQRTPVFEIMSKVGVTAGYQARSRNLTLRMLGLSDLEVFVDRQLMISALANLVQNALKFTVPGGVVQVRTRKVEDRILIEIQDQCGGLADGAAEEMFKPYVQNSADRTGLGLGLTISRQAIELNHGLLRVENIPGEGCIFVIDLPEAGRDS